MVGSILSAEWHVETVVAGRGLGNTTLVDEEHDYTGVHTATGDITIRSLDALTYSLSYTRYAHLPLILKP